MNHRFMDEAGHWDCGVRELQKFADAAQRIAADLIEAVAAPHASNRGHGTSHLGRPGTGKRDG